MADTWIISLPFGLGYVKISLLQWWNWPGIVTAVTGKLWYK
jgi:hypothetical protein